MGQGHAGKGKPSKLTFVTDDSMLMTTGFSSTGQRQFAIWDSVSITVCGHLWTTGRHTSSDIPVTETQTDTEMIDISKTHTETNTEKIFNIYTLYI